MKTTKNNITRRALLGRAALGTGTLATAMLSRVALAQDTPPAPVAPPVPATPPAPAKMPPKAPAVAPTDLQILTFALGLERLESSYYSQALGAHQTRAYLSGRLLEAAQEIASNETSHVQTLEAAITAAGGTLPGNATYKFPDNVFISPIAFAWFGHTLEDIGIGAYLGAVGQIKSDALRRAAASIYGAETRHAATLRLLGGFTASPHYFESPLTVAQVQGLIAPYIV